MGAQGAGKDGWTGPAEKQIVMWYKYIKWALGLVEPHLKSKMWLSNLHSECEMIETENNKSTM